MNPEQVSEAQMHLWYLFHAKDERIKPVERVKESYGVNRVERIEPSSPARGINRNYHDLQKQRIISRARAEYRSRNIPEPEPIEVEEISEPWLGKQVNEYA